MGFAQNCIHINISSTWRWKKQEKNESWATWMANRESSKKKYFRNSKNCNLYSKSVKFYYVHFSLQLIFCTALLSIKANWVRLNVCVCVYLYNVDVCVRLYVCVCLFLRANLLYFISQEENKNRHTFTDKRSCLDTDANTHSHTRTCAHRHTHMHAYTQTITHSMNLENHRINSSNPSKKCIIK